MDGSGISSSFADACLSLVQQSATRTLEMLQEMQRDLFNRARGISALDAHLNQRKQHCDELERLVHAREEEVERQWGLIEGKEREVLEAQASVVRPWVSWCWRSVDGGVLGFMVLEEC
jgi:cob(I)alamin adenosyltransferase